MWFKDFAKDRQNCYNVTLQWPTGVFLGLALQCELLPVGGSNVLQSFRPTNSFQETWMDYWDTSTQRYRIRFAFKEDPRV